MVAPMEGDPAPFVDIQGLFSGNENTIIIFMGLYTN